MKKLMQVFVAVVFAAVTQVVHAATWTGKGDQTSWGDPNNWEEQHLPSGNTEDAIFAPTSPITVNLGNEIRQIAKLKVSGAKVTFTSGGDNHYLLLTGIEATAPIDMNVPVQSKAGVIYSLVGGSDFRKNIRNWNQYATLVIKIASGVVNFHGDIEHYEISGGAGVAGSAAGDCAHFYGKLTATWFSWGRFENRSGWCYVHSTGNPVKNVNLAFSTIHCCDANAFSATTVLNWDGYYRETALKHGSYDFLGNDQTIAHVVANTVYDTKDNFRHLRSSTGDMTLTLKATASATARVDVNEGVSIVYDPQGDYTQEFAAYPSPMTGSITVKGGTFKVSGGATFADASAITIDAGATFDLNSTAANALGNVPEVNLNGTLKVAATATNPFGGDKTTLKIGTGTVDVPSGANVKVCRAEIGGNPLDAKTYKARGSAATGEECDWVTGAGTVTVLHGKHVWTGAAGNGLWNDPDNWGGAVPASNEDVTISPAAPVTISLPNTAITVGKLTLGGATAKLVGSNWFAASGIDASVAVDFDVNLNSSVNCTFKFAKGGDIRKTFNFPPYRQLTLTGGDVLNVWGEVTGGASTYLTGAYGSGGLTTEACVHFYGKVTLTQLAWGANWSSGWCYLHASNNVISSITFAYTTLNVMAENAFSASQVLKWNDGAYTEEAEKHCSYDFHGKDQIANRVSAPNTLANKDDSRKIRSSEGAMTLTLKGTDNASARARVYGPVSLVWDPTGDFTQEFVAYPSDTTGSITVKGGTFKVSGGATFADASAVTIDAGATFDLNSTAANALGNVPEVNLNGTLKVAATATNPFGGDKTTLKIGTGAVDVPSGMNVKVNMAEQGGEFLAAKTYKAVGSAAAGEECGWVTGEGTVQVMSILETHETRVWTGAAGNGLWNDPGNWQGGVVPRSFDTASFSDSVIITDGFNVDHDRTIVIQKDCTVQINGEVSGGAIISCIGNEGILELRGNNTFTGDLIISNSIVKAYGENALSSSNLGAIRVIKDGHTAGANLQLSGVRIRKVLYNSNKNDTANQWASSISCEAETTNSFEGGFTCTDGHLRMSVDTTAKLTISGGMSFSHSYFITRKAGAEVVISGTSAGFPVYDNSGSAADAFMTFACGANVIGTSGGLVATRGISDAMRTTVDNAFRGDSHCYFGGENAKLDLCGHNQQFGRIMAMSGKPAGVICSQEPATLTLIGNETYSNNAVFQGQVSLTKNGTGTVTLQSASTSSGALSVGGGTLKIAAGAGWAGAHINIANGTVLDVADKGAFARETSISITGTGYVNIPAGVTLRCTELTVGGVKKTGFFNGTDFVKGGGTLVAGRIGLFVVAE